MSVKERGMKMEQSVFVNSSWWLVSKPFINAGAAAALNVKRAYFLCGFYESLIRKHSRDGTQVKLAQENRRTFTKLMPAGLLHATVTRGVMFGVFDRSIRWYAVNHLSRSLLWLFAGAAGGFVSTPIYRAHTHMMTNATLPPNRCKEYKDIYHALHHIAANEGASGLWKGASYFAKINAAYGMGMLTSYKWTAIYLKDTVGLQKTKAEAGAAMASGLFSWFCQKPVKTVLDRMINMKPDSQGRYPYTSSLDCAWKMLNLEGPLAFYAGFARPMVASCCSVTAFWIILETIRDFEDSILDVEL